MNPIHLFAAVHIFPRQMCSFHSILETVFSSFLESLMEENDVTRLLVLTVKWLFKWPARLKILSVWLTKKDWGENKLLLSLVLQLCFSNSAAIDAFSVCSTTALEILRQNETVSDVIVLLWLSSRNFLFFAHLFTVQERSYRNTVGLGEVSPFEKKTAFNLPERAKAIQKYAPVSCQQKLLSQGDPMRP